MSQMMEELARHVCLKNYTLTRIFATVNWQHLHEGVSCDDTCLTLFGCTPIGEKGDKLYKKKFTFSLVLSSYR